MARGQRTNEYISYPKVRDLIERAEPLESQALLAIMYGTGCRVGELCRGYYHKYHIFKYKKTGKDSYTKKLLREEEDYTDGIKRENITHDDRAVYILLPNFKYKKMKEKRAYISKVAEPWIINIILEYLANIPENTYLFNFSRTTALRRLAEVWPYTSHSLRVSRSMHLYYDMRISLMDIKDQLGHAGLTHLTSYLRSQPDRYLDQMEKATLPEVIK